MSGSPLKKQAPAFHTQGAKPGARWQKVLFVRQPYPDNHVDETFLASLVTNANVQQYEFWSMVRSTAVVIQQISTMAIFFLGFALVHTATVAVGAIALVNLALLAGLVVAAKASGPRFHSATLLLDLARAAQVGVIFLAVLFALSPILATLTQSYCNDTIWAGAIILSAMHLFFHPYHTMARPLPALVGGTTGTGTGTTPGFSGAVSLNAAIFAAVLLASRLPTTTHAFVFVVLAIQLFALFPILRDYIRVRSEAAHLWLTAILFVVTAGLLLASNRLLATLYVAGAAFIAFVCPLWLLSIQKYKNEIQGPWDIATVAQFST